MGLSKSIIDLMENRLRDVAWSWGVTPERAAKILAGPEHRDFWKSIDADEFLNFRLGKSKEQQ